MTCPTPFDPKRHDEIEIFGCDFSKRLFPGESIISADVRCVLKGDVTETNITAMLLGPPSIVGASVSQRVVDGDVNVWYSMIFHITTSTGRILEPVRDFRVVRRCDDV